MAALSPFLKRISQSAPLRNTGWLLAERIVALVIGFATTLFVARYLGPTGYGRLSFLTAAVAFMAPIAGLGLAGLVTRDLVNNRRGESSILGSSVLLRLAGGVTALGILWSISLIGEWLPASDRPWLLVLAAAEILTAFAVVDAWFQARVLSRPIALARTVAHGAGALFKVALVAAQAKFGYFVVAQAVESALTSCAALAVYQKHSGRIREWRFSAAFARRILGESWWLIPSGFTAVIYLKLDQLMLGSMVNVQEVGVYAAAARLSEVWYFLPIALVQSFFPQLLNLRATDGKAYHARLQTLFGILFWLAFLVALVMTGAATPLVVTLFGEAFRPAGAILAIHVWAGLFIFMRALLSKWLIAEQLTRFSLVTHSLGAVVNVLANLILIPSFGGQGAAIATLLSYATASWLALFLYQRTRGIAIMMTVAPLALLRLTRKKRRKS